MPKGMTREQMATLKKTLQQRDEARARVTELQVQLDQLRAQQNDLVKSAVARAMAEVTETTTRLEGAHDQLRALETVRDQLQRELNSTKGRVNGLSAELEAAHELIKSLETESRTELKKQVADLQRRLAKKAEELVQADARATEKLKSQQETSDRVIASLAHQVDEYAKVLGLSKVG